MSVLKNIGALLSVTAILIWFIYSINVESYFIDNEKNISFSETSVSEDTKDYIKRISFLENQVEKNSIQQGIILNNLNKLLEQTKSNNSETKLVNYKDELKDDSNLPSVLTPESIKEREKIERQHFDEVQNNFELEQKDDNWSINEEQRLRTVLQQEGLNEAAINDIDCRTKTCRADISHKNRINAEDFLDVLVRSVHNTAGELEFVADEDGGITTVLYLTPNQ